jgi:hypothetical protein
VRAIVTSDSAEVERGGTELEEATDARVTYGCHEGSALVASDDHAACIAQSLLCPRSSAWNSAARACVPRAACGLGAVAVDREASKGSAAPCISVATPPLVRVGAWTRHVLGTDGGSGSSRLCPALAREPWTFDVGYGGARAVALQIQITFPNNDVTLLAARVDASDASGQPLPAPAVALAERTVASLLGALRAMGGTADSASVSTRVTCQIPGGSPPTRTSN